jgi:hypothetical protein
MGVSEAFQHKTQLNDALIESYADLRFGQFSLGLEPLWDWDCSVLDR